MNRHHQKKEIEALRSEISALKCEAKIRETYQDEQQDDEEKS